MPVSLRTRLHQSAPRRTFKGWWRPQGDQRWHVQAEEPSSDAAWRRLLERGAGVRRPDGVAESVVVGRRGRTAALGRDERSGRAARRAGSSYGGRGTSPAAG
jgi:hypothetical protein